jgi:nucleoside-diphosphate-sugar epimerase
MKILVTGGAGYVGSVLMPLLLAEGHQVRTLDNLTHGGRSLLGIWDHPAFDFRRGDIRRPEDVRAALEGMDGVVHLAAIVGDPACAREPQLAREVNQQASLSLLEESVRAGVRRFVFASTCSNYGRVPDSDTYVDENAPLAPVSLYAETKVAVEKAMLNYAGNGTAFTPLRFATVYGISPRMRFDLTVNEFTLAIVGDRKLTVFGEQFWRPYIHVADLSRAIATVLAAPEDSVDGQVFNVGDTKANYRKQDLVRMILPYAPDAVIEYVHKTEDPRDYRVCFSKIREQLGFMPSHTVESGIAALARLVREGTLPDYTDPAFRN